MAAHPGLVAKLRRFSHPVGAQLAAGLSLFPEFHAQTIRLEILHHLISVCCTGTKTPERDDVAEWAGKYMANSPFARLEDPVEDVFVGSVNTSFGGFRLLMGNLSDSDFWLERLLLFLSHKQEFPPFGVIVARVLPLLRLSETLLGRVGLRRYTRGGGNRASKIQVPRWRDLQSRTSAVAFSDAELDAVGLTRQGLGEFTITEAQRSNLIDQTLWNTALERCPIIEIPDGIIIATPSSLGRSALRYMVEAITRSMGGMADIFFQSENASMFVNEVASRLSIQSVQFPKPHPPEHLPPLYPFFGQFDVGKAAILLTYSPSLVDAAADFGGQDEFSQEQEAALDAYLQACAAEFEQSPEFTGGMVLVAVAGIRMNLSWIREWSPRWRVYICTLPDWLFITSGGSCNALRLWKFGDHQELLIRKGIEIQDLAGLVNTFAAWKSNGFRLLPRSQDGRGLTVLSFDCVFAVELRVRSRTTEDAHCVLSHDGQRWTRMLRHNAEPIFAEDATVRLYVDYEAVKHGQLIGCFEEADCVWWTKLQGSEGVGELRSLAFQLWECVFNWIARVVQVAYQEWPQLTSTKSVQVSVSLEDLPKWNTSNQPERTTAESALSLSVSPASSSMLLTFKESFLTEFKTPKNTAEQKMISALLTGAAQLAGAEVGNVRHGELLRKVVKNDDARYFHIIRAFRTEQLFAGPDRPHPLLVADEDFAFSQIGLAHLVGRSAPGHIVDLSPCRDFLKDAVEKVWERIEASLSLFDRKSVLISCFHELDELGRDEGRWELTTRSQFALRSNSANVHEAIMGQRSEREKACLCNRLLVETAQYACQIGSKVFSRADHLTLLADMALLIMLAHHRDAIAYGFIPPKINILPNGEIEIDTHFYSTVLKPYVTKRSRERTDSTSDDYEEYYLTKNPPEQRSFSEPLDEAAENFDKVFVSEFDFSTNQLVQLLDQFRVFALQAGNGRGELDEPSISKFLHHCGFSQTQSDSFLDRFTLPIRSAWNADLPGSARKEDVFPWRFRRQLSLLARPIVQVAVAPRAWLISVPLLERGVAYFIGNIEQAHFPKDVFRSRAMHHYIGDTVNKLGHAFAKSVETLITQSGYQAEGEIEMTKLGASKNAGLGDIDVLAWEASSGTVLAIECKRLREAVTVREVIQRLEDFRGNREERDSLGRHLRRVDWLKSHLEALSNITNISAANIRLIPLLVTSETVPMQFFAEMNLSVSNVIPYSELEKHLPTILTSGRTLGGPAR